MANQKYLNLVTSEHKTKPNFIAWLTAGLDKYDDAVTAINAIPAAYDIDLAVGVQLDTVGELLGSPRLLNFQPINGPALMTDETYRIVLKSKVIQNQWDGTRSGYDSLVSEVFPNDAVSVFDNQDMSITVMCRSVYMSDYIKELFTHGYLLPEPEGVKVNYIFPTDSVFAYGLDTAVFGGYGSGYWAQYE